MMMKMKMKMKIQRRATGDGVNVLHVDMQASSSFGTVEPWSPRVSIL